MTEFELKFQIPASSRRDVAKALRRGRSQQLALSAIYFDTEDGRLAAHGIALRLRQEGERWVQTAKAPGDSAVMRHEHNVERPAGGEPAVDLSLHDGTAVGRKLAKALGDDKAEPMLLPVYRTEVQRSTRELRDGSTVVELAYDEGRITAGNAQTELCELEFELKAGDAWVLLELARGWMLRHQLWLDTVSKAERGQRLAHGRTAGPPRKAQPPRLRSGQGGAEILQAIVQACLAQILPNASDVAAGSGSGEHVHQLRVGLRRLRTALRELGCLGARIDPAWEPVLRASFRMLGEYRDREQLLGTLQPMLQAAGGPVVDWNAAFEAAPPDPAAVVQEPEFQGVLLDLLRFTLTPAAAASALRRGGEREELGRRLHKLHRKVRRDGKRFDQLAPELQHRLRKRAKRLRYLAEFVAPLYRRSAVGSFLAALEPVQEALGRYSDRAVARSRARALTPHDPAAWFAVGWLEAGQQATRKACAKALRRFDKAKGFWDEA